MMKTIGIKLADGSFYPVLEENTQAYKALELTTVHNNQTKVVVDLYRSETSRIKDAEYIESLQIENLIAHPSGEPDISFTASLDENNQLIAKIKDTETGNQSNVSITLVERENTEALVEDDKSLEENEEPPELAATGVVILRTAGPGLLATAEAIREASEEAEGETVEEAPVGEETAEEDAPSVDEPVAEEVPTSEDAPAVEEPAEEGSVGEEPVIEEGPADEVPISEEVPVEVPVEEETPAVEEPVIEEPSEEEETSISEEITLEDTSVEEVAAEEPVEDVPAEEEVAISEDALVEEEPVIEESPAEDFSLGEEPVEEEVSEETEEFSLDDIENNEENAENIDIQETEESSEQNGENMDDINKEDDFSNLDLPDLDINLPEEKENKSEDDLSLPDFNFQDDFSTEENSDTSDTSSLDLDLPDFPEEPESQEAETPNFDDFDLPETDNSTAAPAAGLDFAGLYDDEPALEDEECSGKKIKLPLIICIICAVICILATCALLFIIPSKYNLINRGAEKTEKVIEATPSEEPVEPEAEEEEEPEPEPIPEVDAIAAKEDEIVVIEKAEEVVPEQPPVVEEKPKNIVYKIKWGDTLWDIANTYYKNPWRYKEIAKYNGIKDPDHIVSGTIIEIPAE